MSSRSLQPDTITADAALLTIDLGALAENWRSLRDRVAPAECAAVVKADAYGLGLEPVATALAGVGCQTFFVAHLDEAARLRRALPGAIIYVLNGLLPGTAPRFVALGARPILGSWEELGSWSDAGGLGPAAIHIDTGMSRLGFPPGDAALLAADARVRAIGPSLVMSHFTSAEVPGHVDTPRQVATFEAARALFAGAPASLANSSGIFVDDAPALDLVRPGYALYGGNPTPGQPNPMRPVIRLDARIIQTSSIAAGETVGYNAAWTAPGPRRLATISVGYADGYPRYAGATDRTRAAGEATGAALVGGRLCPMVGRVSMDLIVLDVTDAPEARRGTVATLIGDALDIDEVGRRAGTIGYEILTGLGRRYARC